MYCPSCGVDVNSGLSFCNRCGARISAGTELDPNALSESSFNLLVGALLTIPIVGIGLILGLMVVMKQELGFKDEIVMTAVFLSFLLLLAAEAGFIWLMITRTKKRKVPADKTDKKKEIKGSDPEAKILGEGTPTGIPASVHSVTDHTTRNLDPVTREPKNQ